MFSVSRPNTLEFALPNVLRSRNNQVSRDEVVKSIGESLGKDAFKSVKCVQKSSTGFSFRVTFKANSVAPRESLLTKGLFIRGCFCYLSAVESQYYVVIVSNLPCELEDDDVATVLKDYGDVKEIFRHKDKLGLETGDRRVLMELERHIPGKLSFEPFWAYVKYRGQPLSCLHCNW